jgi:hypothetical protein
MKRRQFMLTAAAMIFAAHPAFAQDIVGTITDQLRAQGYTSISVTRTLLGRQRIFARSSEYQREIIVNARTGEILRDYWTVLSGAKVPSDGGMSIVEGGSGSSSDDDDDDDDDEDDKDDDEDNSGHGNSDDDEKDDDNSGSGSSDD